MPDGSEPKSKKAIAKLDSPITAVEVKEMLRKAGAPFPLVAPERCDEAARRIEGLRITLSRWKKTPLAREVEVRGQDAVDELKRVLPELLMRTSLPVGEIEIQGILGISDALRLEMEARRVKLMRLYEALFDIGPKHRKRDVLREWGIRASFLFAWYRTIANPKAGRSGPAVRFVKAALLRIGDGVHTLVAIEKTLQRK
jgi:hypothetical protein